MNMTMAGKTLKKYILFDLDGTLVDSGDGIINSVVYSLDKLGIAAPERESLKCFIGPPLDDTYMKMFGMNADEAKHAISVYREYYRAKGLYECRVYDGIPELLARLNEAGAVPVVATSKPAVFSRMILEQNGLMRHFAFLSGAELDGRRTDKAEVIAYAMGEMNIPKDDMIMVGDRSHDVIGAKKLGIPSVGVLYGFGSRDEHEAAGADYICDDTYSLSDLLLCR